MLIIIEGCDLTGKSTLAQKLQERLYPNAEVWHAGPPTEHPLTAYEEPLASYDPLDELHVILDRWQLGEHVWPHVFGRESALDLAVGRHIELYLHSRGAHTVYAERSADVLARAIDAADPPEPIRGHQVPEVLELFRLALAFNGRPYSTWDYEVDDTGATGPIKTKLDDIVEQASYMVNDVDQPWHVTSEWIGNPKPRVLLVGDEFGLVRPGVTDVPFGPYRNTSGHYLMSALPAENWRHYAITNAHVGRTGRIAPLGELWEALNKPLVVGLGNNAADALRLVGVPHETIPHPQYWRRFHFHDMKTYTAQLRQAVNMVC